MSAQVSGLRVQWVAIVMTFVACAFVRGQEQAPAVEYSARDPQSLGATMQRTGGSLLRATVAARSASASGSGAKTVSVSYMAVPEPEPRTIKKHDTVEVIVSENSDASAQGTTDLKKDQDFDAQLTNFLRLRPSNFAVEGRTPAQPIQLTASGSRNFKGDATANRSDAFTARVAAEVIDVRPNGNIVVQATKHVQWDEEDITITLTGACRAEDVTADNTVLSSQLLNLDVVKKTKGAVHDTTKRGLVGKILDQLNPF